MKRRKQNKNKTPSDDTEQGLLNRIAGLLEILVRVALQTAKGDRTQKEMIAFLQSTGCGPSEIANLLGTTANTVRVALATAKKKKAR